MHLLYDDGGGGGGGGVPFDPCERARRFVYVRARAENSRGERDVFSENVRAYTRRRRGDGIAIIFFFLRHFWAIR